MKQFWSGSSVRRPSLVSKHTLALSFLVTLLCMAFLTSGIASAHGIPQLSTSHSHSTHKLHPNGSNGQQLAFWVGGSIGAESVVVNGPNQDNNGSTNCYPSYGNDVMPVNQWNYFPGYWWKGQVGLQYFSGPGCNGTPVYSAVINVPAYQSGDYTCVALYTQNDPQPGSC